MRINGIEFNEADFEPLQTSDTYCMEGCIVSECGGFVVYATKVHDDVECDEDSVEEV